MDFVEFLTARLDEAEQAAREAAVASFSEHWRVGDNALYGTDDVSNNPGPFIAPYNDYLADAVGAFIAYWDPARALAEIEAKREILKLYRSERAIADKLGAEGESRVWLLQAVLGDLAGPYADHPDYDEVIGS